MPLFRMILAASLFLVLTSWVLIILRWYLVGLKILLVAVNSICSLGPVAVLPSFSSAFVYMTSFAVFGYTILRVVSFLRSNKMRRREMFDGWGT